MTKIKQLTTPLLTGESVAAKRTELKQYFFNSWQTYESLFALINNDEAYFLRPEPLRHPLIFYFGHTATFYVNKLMLGKYISQRVNEKLEAVCAVGVDEMSWDDLDSANYQWPQVEEVRQYRNQVFSLVVDLIENMPLTLPITQDSLAWVILMGCEHERIHLETSSVIMRQLDLTYLTVNEQWQSCADSDVAPNNLVLQVEGKTINLAKPKTDESYGWDNEYGDCNIAVNRFLASKYLVSNQEFMAFVEAGGYQSPHYWTEEGQQWLVYTKAAMPRFWRQHNGEYWQRNLTNEIKLPLNWPVEVNYLEAKAFCQWKSATEQNFTRLPTEAEWHCLRNLSPSTVHEWQETPANINLAYYASSCPVNRFSHSQFFDVLGNVWQWTESAIDGFNGFTVHPLYDDFSTPTFDGKHNLIKGGSWISTGNETLQHSRYAFRRHFYQHAGFRYVVSETAEVPTVPVNPFETNPDVCQQLLAHYFDYKQTATDHYLTLCAELIVPWCSNRMKALDLGSKVGRLSFILANDFDHVDGVDFSARYIQHGVRLQQVGKVRFVSSQEGELVDYHEASLNDFGFEKIKNKVHFSQGDACNLKAKYLGYDLIVANSLLKTLYDPALFLKTIEQRLNSQGVLAIISAYQWSEKATPKNKWLSGIKVNGENVLGLDALTHYLADKFDLVSVHNVEQVKVINSRKRELIEHEVSIWRLKN